MGLDKDNIFGLASDFETVGGMLDQARDAYDIVLLNLEREVIGTHSSEYSGERETLAERLLPYLGALSVIRRDIDASAAQLNKVTAALYAVSSKLKQ